MSVLIDKNNIPRHIAVVMDGNGRWAQQKGAKRIFGHKNATKSVREITEGCAELGVDFLTLYTFSTENWSRPKEEVSGLMELLVNTLKSEIKTMIENNTKFSTIGDIKALPEKVQRFLQDAKEKTRNNDGLNLILALNYSGRSEITETVGKIVKQVENGELKHHQINEDLISDNLSTKGIPDPELLIRTSGEIRISNFLLWQLAYSELYFTDTLWPDFRKKDLHEAIANYQKRERRFGKISEEVN